MHKKICLLILDGWGIAPKSNFSAIEMAKTPFIENLLKEHPNARLYTHGENVGLPKGQMGNSEVGHMNIGAGRIVNQDLMSEGMSLANIIRNDFPNLGTLCNCGGGKFNSQMKKAYNSGADVVVILEEESCDGKPINAKIRRVDDSNESKIVKISDISKELRDFLPISDG